MAYQVAFDVGYGSVVGFLCEGVRGCSFQGGQLVDAIHIFASLPLYWLLHQEIFVSAVVLAASVH